MRWVKQLFVHRHGHALTEHPIRELAHWPESAGIWADGRFACRQLRKSPGFAAAAILTLALGSAATVAIFGFVDSALIRPLPYPDLPRLMGVFKTTQLGSQYAGYSYPDYLDLQRSNRVFVSTAAYTGDGFVLSDAAGAHLVHGVGVTPNFFRILGVTPILGRDFPACPASEDLLAQPSTVILSYAAWQHWFGGTAGVLGKTVTLTGNSYTVIGVLPRNFQFAPTASNEFWTTLRPYAGDACYASRGCMAMLVIARLKDGVSVQQALGDLRALAAREAKLYPDPDKYRGANVVPLTRAILGPRQPILLALLAGAGLLLLIAYVNVTGLLLVRSEKRRHEFAVRGVLGARRRRLMQQFAIEGLVVVAASSTLGLFAAMFTHRLLLRLIPADMLEFMPYLLGGWSWHVTLFAVVLVVIALILFAVAPALQLPFANLRDGLAVGGSSSSGTAWRHLGAKLVVLELATTMVLLAGAGLLGKSLYRLLHVSIGFEPSHLATFDIGPPESRYSTAQQEILLQREILSRLQSLPGIISVGITRDLPVTGVSSTQIGFVASPGLGVNNEVGHQVVSPGYLSDVLKARLVRGRYLSESDNANAPLVALVNETFARRFFPDKNPLGKQFFYHAHDINREASQPPIEIVGVLANIRDYALDETPEPVIYTPYEQWPEGGSVVVRTSQDAASVLPLLVATIHKIDADIIVADTSTMAGIIQHSWPAYMHRASAWLAGGFAALALLLSMVGLYGVIAYSVSRRTREIGVRMALGATRGSVYKLILKEAGWLTLVGLAIGVCGSVAAGTFMRSLLFGVRSWDVSTLIAVAAVLVASTLLASYVPARRAACIDPLEALRAE
jgi:macrolide transport system ATP-binding/permease protein